MLSKGSIKGSRKTTVERTLDISPPESYSLGFGDVGVTGGDLEAGGRSPKV